MSLFSPPLPEDPFKCGPYSSDHLLHGCCIPDHFRHQPLWLFLFKNGPIHNTANPSLMWPKLNLMQQDPALQNSDWHSQSHGAFFFKNLHTVFAICPNPDCHQTYEPKFEQGSSVPIYPKQCNHCQFYRGQKCATPLLKPKHVDGHMIYIPIKPFLGFSFKDWLGALLSWLGYEKKMDSSWDSCQPGHDPSLEMKDIFDGGILHNFEGPDGSHFSVGYGEAWYVFSMCIDFFNPLENKQAGKKKSTGLISLVCLNLPPKLQYRW